MQGNFSELHIKKDEKTGLMACVAIHSLKEERAIGGCRCIHYNSFNDAIHDAINLANAMSKKIKFCGYPFGGGKCVLMKPEKIENREEYFSSFGHFINSLNGRFITGCDSGVTQNDMEIASHISGYITGLPDRKTNKNMLIDLTALGVYEAMKSAVNVRNENSLGNMRVLIQGVGQVGSKLVELLSEGTENITITDINKENIKKITTQFKNVRVIEPHEIFDESYDVFCPCALGNVINDASINKLKFSIICGAANNQLNNEKLAETLLQKNITYIPDFIANAGGATYAAGSHLGESSRQIQEKIMAMIPSTVERIINLSMKDNITTIQAAELI